MSNTRVAHFSDVHLGPLPISAAFDQFSFKRIVGAISWHANRKQKYETQVADALLNDVYLANPDHIAFTGDGANIASPMEFPRLRQWIDRLANPQDLSFVPGNHDLYAPLDHAIGLAYLEPFMKDGEGPLQFPYVRYRRNIAFVGLNSSQPRALWSAGGRLGEKQLQQLAFILADLKAKGFYRLVMIHHPPGVGLAGKRRALDDAPALTKILVEQGAELVIYGHNHHHAVHWLDAEDRRIPLVGVGSGSAGAATSHPAEWNLYDITRKSGTWLTTATTRSWDGSQFRDSGVFSLVQAA